VLTYRCPRPWVVDVREPGTTVKVEMYLCPRPLTVEANDGVLTYPKAPREFVFDVRVDPKLKPVTVEVRSSAKVLIYPSPYTVDVIYVVVEVKNDVVPRPATVDTSEEVLIYFCPNPATVDAMNSPPMEDV